MINDASAAEGPSLDDYVRALWRRKHYVVLLTIVGLILSILYVRSSTPKYSSEARVVVGRLPQESDFAGPNLEREREIITSAESVRRVISQLSLSAQEKSVQDDLTIAFVPDSDVMRIGYQSADPKEAADVVTAFAANYAKDREAAKTEYYNAQLASLQGSLTTINQEITKTNADLAGRRDAQQRFIIETTGRTALTAAQQAEQSRLNLEVQELETKNAQLSAQRLRIDDDIRALTADQRSAPFAAQVARSGRIADAPDGLSNKALYAIGTMMGLVIGAAIAFFLDRFDRTARSEGDVQSSLGVAVLASVPAFPRNAASNGLIMLRNATGRRPAAARDSYRRLRSALDFLAKRGDMKTFIVTSARPGDGKSTTAVNLAIAAAQTGRRVALVSGDMHRPSLERLLSLPDNAGLSDYLLDESEAILTAVPSIPNLTAVTSGRAVDSPAELLASTRVAELVKLLEENHDVVIFDTPPVLNASDSLALASRVDGVIVVTDSRTTDSDDLAQLRDETRPRWRSHQSEPSSTAASSASNAIPTHTARPVAPPKPKRHCFSNVDLPAREHRRAGLSGRPRALPVVGAVVLHGHDGRAQLWPAQRVAPHLAHGVGHEVGVDLLYPDAAAHARPRIATYSYVRQSDALRAVDSRAAALDLHLSGMVVTAGDHDTPDSRLVPGHNLRLLRRHPLHTRGECSSFTAKSILGGTLVNVMWIVAIPRYGRVIDPFDPANSGIKGVMSNKNTLGQFCAVAVLVLLMARACLRRNRNVYLIAALVNLALLVRSDSKTSLVALLGVGAFAVVFRAFRAQKQLFMVVVIMVFLASIGTLMFILQNKDTLASGLGRNGNLTGRTQLWADLAGAAKRRNLLGHGYGGFWNGYLSPAGEIWHVHTWQPPDAHNVFFQLWIDLGLVGVAIYFVGFLRAFRRGMVYLRDNTATIALFPLLFFSFELLMSITEHGNLSRNYSWALHVIATVAVGLPVTQAARTRVSTERFDTRFGSGPVKGKRHYLPEQANSTP